MSQDRYTWCNIWQLLKAKGNVSEKNVYIYAYKRNSPLILVHLSCGNRFTCWIPACKAVVIRHRNSIRKEFALAHTKEEILICDFRARVLKASLLRSRYAYSEVNATQCPCGLQLDLEWRAPTASHVPGSPTLQSRASGRVSTL